MPKTQKLSGFTLVELLVVIAIIGILVSLLLPAVNAARQAARRTSCKNNIRQVALANINYGESNKKFPASFDSGNSMNGNASVLARILPYLEESGVYKHIDFNIPYSNWLMPDGTKTSANKIPPYVCPGDPEAGPVVGSTGIANHYTFNYAPNLGTWMVYDWATKTGGDGAFYPNSKLSARHFVDGMSKTISFAEVKSRQPGLKNANSAMLPIPTLSSAVSGLGGTFSAAKGHTEWVEGRASHAGFTATFPPNTSFISNQAGIDYDIDWVNNSEALTLTNPTMAAVTSRSHHPGVVSAAMMDGSTHNVSDDISIGTWRGLATRAGRETASIE